VTSVLRQTSKTSEIEAEPTQRRWICRHHPRIPGPRVRYLPAQTRAAEEPSTFCRHCPATYSMGSFSTLSTFPLEPNWNRRATQCPRYPNVYLTEFGGADGSGSGGPSNVIKLARESPTKFTSATIFLSDRQSAEAIGRICRILVTMPRENPHA
jgi:hypothetical protein